MLRIIICFIFTCLMSISLFAETPHTKSIKRVIYITLDGVRWQDIFLDHSHLPIFWEKYAKDASIYGAPDSNSTMEVASTPISLPSYQSQMAGAVQPCDENDCGRIRTETLPEHLISKLKLDKKDVVSISSWEVTDDAWEHIANTAFSNNGTRPMYDPDTHTADAVMYELNQQQAADYPGDDTRLDKYTFAQGMHYLEKYQPRFLWISFGDADDYAHEGNLAAYNQTLTFYDQALDQVMTTLKKLHLDEETMVIVTTDHGRGDGENWRDHGPELPESKRTWAFVYNGELIPISKENDTYHYSTLSIRPTVEKVFGMDR